MKNSEFIRILKQRDELIDLLILSHLQSLGKLYSLETKQGLSICKKMVVNWYAKEEIIDAKISKEMDDILSMDITINESTGLIEEDRRCVSETVLTDITKIIRQKALKKIENTNFQRKH